jgi:hypothetical protein
MTEQSKHARDFDFIHGKWNIKNKFLKERLAGSEEWGEFDATYECRSLLQGLGNIDQFFATRDGIPFEGVSLRLFDLEAETWSIYWIASTGPKIDTPMIGQFVDGIGTFFATEEINDTPTRVRFLWTIQDENHAQWEQAFSVDNEETWETNWIMEFTRQ